MYVFLQPGEPCRVYSLSLPFISLPGSPTGANAGNEKPKLGVFSASQSLLDTSLSSSIILRQRPNTTAARNQGIAYTTGKRPGELKLPGRRNADQVTFLLAAPNPDPLTHPDSGTHPQGKASALSGPCLGSGMSIASNLYHRRLLFTPCSSLSNLTRHLRSASSPVACSEPAPVATDREVTVGVASGGLYRTATAAAEAIVQ